MWRVEDGRQMARLEANDVECLAVSKDGRWIAAGTQVIVWDAKTYKQPFSQWDRRSSITGVDFSPDSTRLVAASYDRIASIWDIAARERAQTLHHGDSVVVAAAKYSAKGDRIATATPDSILVWDSSNGHLLVQIPVRVAWWPNTGLLWFNDTLLVISDNKIKQIKASTGPAVSEWGVLNTFGSCIALPRHGGFIAYSAQYAVTLRDTATHTRLGLIQHPEGIRSIAVSPDDRFLAIAGLSGKITFNSLSHISVSIVSRSTVVHINGFLTPIIFY